MVALVDTALAATHAAVPGSPVVLVGGTLPGVAGGTNTLRVLRVGDEAG